MGFGGDGINIHLNITETDGGLIPETTANLKALGDTGDLALKKLAVASDVLSARITALTAKLEYLNAVLAEDQEGREAARQKILSASINETTVAVQRQTVALEINNAKLAAAMAPVPVASGLAVAGKQLDDIGAKFEKLGTKIRQQGMNVTMGLGVPLAAIGAISIVAATQFETSMAQIQSQTGGTANEVQVMKRAMLDLASVSAQGPNELAKALFNIESVDIRGAAAIDAMKAAAMGATAGQANLADVTKALAAALVSEVDAGRDAMSTMGIMNSIVEHGRLNMDDFAKSMSTGILAASKNFGVSLTDMGAAMVVLTNSGVDANSAATRLRTTFSLLSAPTQKAADIFKMLGIGTLELSHAVRSGGLVAGLQILKDKLDAFTSDPSAKARIISEAFGGARSSTTVVTLLNQLDQVSKAHNQIAADANRLGVDYANMVDTFGFKWKNFLSNLQVDAIKLGDAMKPLATALFNVLPAIDKVLSAFLALPGPVRTVMVALAGVLIIAGPFMILAGALNTLVGFLASAAGAAIKLYASLLGVSGASASAAVGTEALAGAEVSAAAGALTFEAAAAGLFIGIAALVVVFIAVNEAVKAFTGNSIIDYLTGQAGAADRAAESYKKLGDALELVNSLTSAGLSSDRAREVAIANVTRQVHEESAAWQTLWDIRKGLDESGNYGDAYKQAGDNLSQEKSNIDQLGKSIKELHLSFSELTQFKIDFPELGKNSDFKAALKAATSLHTAFEKQASDWAGLSFSPKNDKGMNFSIPINPWINGMEKTRAAANQTTSAIAEETSGFETLAAATDAAIKALEGFNSVQESFKGAVDVLEFYKAQMAAAGESTKDIDAKIAGLKNTIEQHNLAVSVGKTLIGLYSQVAKQWAESVSGVTRGFVDSKSMMIQFEQILQGLPDAKIIEIMAKLPFNDLEKLAQFIDDIVNKHYTIDVALRIAMQTPEDILAGAGPASGPWSNLPGSGDQAQRATHDWLKGIAASAVPNPNSVPPIYPSGGSGGSGGSTKSENSLIDLAAAFKIFNEQTNSQSIPAFKDWLDMQKKLSDAQDAAAVKTELATNAQYGMVMALGAIQTHILQANESISQFLRNDVYMPALNAFRSALNDLFSQPTKEGQALHMQLLQAQRQKLLDVGNKSALKNDDKNIEAIQHNIDLLNNQNDILKLQAEMRDKTVKSEQDLITASSTLAGFIDTTSTHVFDLGDAAYFTNAALLALGKTAVGAVQAAGGDLTGVPAAPTGATTPLGAGSHAITKPGGGAWTFAEMAWIDTIANQRGEFPPFKNIIGFEKGTSFVPDNMFAFLHKGEAVIPASQNKGRGDINITLNLTPNNSKQEIKDEVMKALDKALVGASYRGSYIGSGAYSPGV